MTRLGGCPCGDLNHRDQTGNCSLHLAADGLRVQCVGEWSKDKHDYLRRYIEATRGARSHYLAPRGRGGAAFIDLFAGPGLACVRETGEVIEGSPLIALRHAEAPFSGLILCDLAEENVSALAKRTAADRARVHVLAGDCNELVDAIMGLVPEHGLNIALVDPFAPRVLRWATLSALGAAKRMDFIIHFPTSAIKRNFEKRGFDQVIDAAIGTSNWRSEIRVPSDVPKLIDYLRRSLVDIGYDGERVRSLPIENSKHGVLYHLVFATKDKLGNKIWQSVARTAPGGQRGFDF